MAWVLRYVENLGQKSKGMEPRQGPLGADEEEKALKYLCKMVQLECYSDDVAKLSAGGSFGPHSML